MPWGSGAYTRPAGSGQWIADRDAAIKITASRHDAHDQDLADGINACLNKNGQNSPSADINWGGKKITGLGTPTASSDAATKGYADTAGSIQYAAGDQVLWRGSSIPTGWTAVAQTDKAIRVVNGTPGSGGSAAFSSVFGAGKVTGNEASHTHGPGSFQVQVLQASSIAGPASVPFAGPQFCSVTGTSAAGSSHNHTLSLDLQYYDMRAIQKS